LLFRGLRLLTADLSSRDKEAFVIGTRGLVISGLCVIAFAAQAQGPNRKPGLWEVTTSMSMTGGPEMPQMPSRTSQVCVTQAMIDKYGGPYSNPQRGNCQLTDVALTATSMSAKLVCSGQANMSGTVQATFVDANTTKTTVHMTMTMGASGRTMDMTTESTATFKGPDCGSVQPLPMPPNK
jgi:hypothetical protein